MKRDHPTPSATSLRRSPREDANRRMTKYFIMMSIRVLCFVLMVVITPYGWHTAALAVGAIFLPYLAVVVANVGEDGHEVRAENPLTALPEHPSEAPRPDQPPPSVIQLRESPPSPPES